MKTSPYRWVILTIFMLITLSIEIQWLTHAAVVRPADVFYKGQFDPSSFLNLDFLEVSYMLIFLVMSFPSSYLFLPVTLFFDHLRSTDRFQDKPNF